MPKPLQRPSWPPTTHVDIFIYRMPLVIPPREPPNVDKLGVGPDSPTSSIQHPRAAYNIAEGPWSTML